MKPLRTIAALVAIALPTTAIQAATPCMQPAEAQALIASFLPDMIRGLRDVCKDSLPAEAFLVKSGGVLADRYEPEAKSAWTAGRAAAVKLSGGDDIFKRLDDESMRKTFGAVVSGEIAKDVKPKDCGTIDSILQALEPLPPANMSTLIGAVLQAAGSDPKQKRGKFPICSAAGRNLR